MFKFNRSSADVVKEAKFEELDIIGWEYNYEFIVGNRLSIINFTEGKMIEYNEPGGTYQEIALNHIHPVFGTGIDIPDGYGVSDNDQIQALLVRKALSHIVNRERIKNEILDGKAIEAASLIPPTAVGFDPSLVHRNYSIASARNYMKMAGYNYDLLVDSNNDGDYGDTNDTTFFDITILAPGTNVYRNQWTEEYALELPKIGIGVKKVHIDTIEDGNGWAEVDARVSEYPDGSPPIYDEGGYDILFLGWSPPSITWDFGNNYLGEENIYNYHNATIQSLLDSYRSNPLESSRIQILHQIQKAFRDDLPAIPIVFEDDTWITSQNITGLSLVLLGTAQQEWENVRKTTWEPPISSKTGDSDGSNSYPNYIIIIGVGGVVAVIVALQFIRFRRK